MQSTRITVLLPCHSLEDFPSWLDGDEARDLREAWTAAWHPALIAATGLLPRAGSLDRHAEDPEHEIYLAPAAFDDRLSVTGLDALGTARLVRRLRDRESIAAAAIEKLGGAASTESATACCHVEDFHALGLAWLLGDLLARRMRSTLAIDEEAFRAAAVAAAEHAIAGRGEAAREKLEECFQTLGSSRKRYYPVDIWLLDLVLLAGSTLGDPLAVELRRPGRRAVVATGELVERLAASRPDITDLMRGRFADGSLAAATGLHDDTSIHRLSAERVLDSLRRSREAWHSHTGHWPITFARRTGGLCASLPRMLVDAGFSSAIYRLFDGTRLPDPGSARMRWESPSGEAIEAISCQPIDARSPGSAMSIADSIGHALDHSHTAILAFAHYPGTADRWYDDFRRITGWTDLFGRFVLPEEVIQGTAGTGVRADFQPDSFAGPTVLASDFEPQPAAASLPLSSPPAAPDGGKQDAAERSRAGLVGLLFGGRGGDRKGGFVLDNGLMLVKVHRETGAMVALRDREGRPNRLSQQVAVRITPPLAAGSRWEDPLDRAEYSRMAADEVRECQGPGGVPAIESHGRLVDDRRLFGSFRQKIWLEPSLAVARFEIEIDLASPLPVATDIADWWHSCVVCRFAWNENTDVDLFRNLVSEASATERSIFHADRFVDLRGTGCTILAGGLRWHVRSSPHMLETILLPAACTWPAPSGGGPLIPDPPSKVIRHLAVGLGLESPLTTSGELLGEKPAAAGPSDAVSGEGATVTDVPTGSGA